jgi:predicted metal-dependent RNase
VKYTDEFSGHAHEKELIEYLSCFNDIKLLAINHGERDAKRQFAHDVYKEILPKNVFILDRENAVRINSFGFEKSLPLDFNFRAFRTKF